MFFNNLKARSPARIALLVVLVFLALFLVSHSYSAPFSSSRFVPADTPKMAITHIVLFKYKDSASHDQIQEISDRFLGLEKGCLHPTSKQAYIKSVSGGTDNSPEGAANGFTHAYVVEFANVEERDYYVDKDPAHDDFKKRLGPLLEKAQVIDFTNGVFEKL